MSRRQQDSTPVTAAFRDTYRETHFQEGKCHPACKGIDLNGCLRRINSGAAVRSTISQAGTTKVPHLVHFIIINMSEENREAHVCNATVPLPVAKWITLQVSLGDSVKITSNTDSRVSRVITILAADEGPRRHAFYPCSNATNHRRIQSGGQRNHSQEGGGC
jgi:hypothetical protein